MASMFSGVRNRTVPQKFAQCIEKDEMTSNLWNWAIRVEKWGNILTVLLTIYGVYISIYQASTVAEIYDKYSSFHLETFLLCLVEWALYVFLVYCTYHIIALLVGSLASIVENTRITANIMMYKEKDSVTSGKVGSACDSETMLERIDKKQDAKMVNKLLDKLYDLE